MTDLRSSAACPACIALPGDAATAGPDGATEDILLSLPAIHCAACISGVERALAALPEVAEARVNLTRRRARVRVARGSDPAAIADHLTGIGYEALPLDTATLTAGESDRAARDLLMRLGVAGFAMMNVMLLSVAVWSGASDATRDLFHWISAGIALPTIAFSARPFFASALGALKGVRLNMDVPISLAILLAAGLSLYETAMGGEEAWFDAALSLTFFLLAGRYLDQKMRGTARSAAAELAALESPTALRLEAGSPRSVPLAEIGVGDRLLVRPGARVPVDGQVLDGASDLDRSFLTGENEPAAIDQGGTVRAGEINLTGALVIRAEAVGGDTVLHGLADLVSVAEDGRSRYNSLADRAARIYAPVVHLLALAGFVAWLWATGDARLALNVAAALLIITCPCALGLAVPAVSTVASGRLFRAGLLVKHGTALERLAEVDCVVLDKTGTLTTGTPTLTNPDDIPAHLAPAALALARASSHPRSRGVAEALEARGVIAAPVSDLREVPGRGVEGTSGDTRVRLGRGGDGGTVLGDGLTEVALRFEDTLRPGAETLVSQLAERGLPVTLLSGDTAASTAALAGRLGISDWEAGIDPAGKAERIARLVAAGHRPLMVGDGLNDTGALAAAHVSLAPASALEAARVAADIVLTGPSLDRVDRALEVARSARARILENFGLAASYNAVAIPVAFAGLASPLAAAIAMSTSSILVSVNALRVR